jgi:hypothetical protein
MNGNDQVSDDDVLCAVSDSLSRVPVARPPQLETVMARGRARQRRRRASGMTAALTVVAAGAAAVTVTALPAGRHPAAPAVSYAVNSAPSARLAAWTVTRQAGGDIKVTINELRDPAGLQRTLRADGVPASVSFLGQRNPACSMLAFDPALLAKILPARSSGVVHHLPGGETLSTGGSAGGDMVIDPAAIPGDVGLQLAFHTLGGGTAGHSTILGRTALVHASPQCTGS